MPYLYQTATTGASEIENIRLSNIGATTSMLPSNLAKTGMVYANAKKKSYGINYQGNSNTEEPDFPQPIKDCLLNRIRLLLLYYD